MGVTSRIEVMVKPAACKARSADSLPEPGPATSTSSVRMPCSCAFFAASSAATCAAYGVDLREPLKPIVPADDQAMVLPCASVMVMVVLLNDEFTCATPEAMFLRSRRRNASGYTSTSGEWSERGKQVSLLAASPFPVRRVTSSCRQSTWPDPCAYARWCGCADHAPATRADGADRDSSRDPSSA